MTKREPRPGEHEHEPKLPSKAQLEAWPHRQYCWIHNSLLGSAVRSKQDYKRIATAPSASSKAKNLAQEILRLQDELAQELRTLRVEKDGTETLLDPTSGGLS